MLVGDLHLLQEIMIKGVRLALLQVEISPLDLHVQVETLLQDLRRCETFPPDLPLQIVILTPDLRLQIVVLSTGHHLRIVILTPDPRLHHETFPHGPHLLCETSPLDPCQEEVLPQWDAPQFTILCLHLGGTTLPGTGHLQFGTVTTGKTNSITTDDLLLLVTVLMVARGINIFSADVLLEWPMTIGNRFNGSAGN